MTASRDDARELELAPTVATSGPGLEMCPNCQGNGKLLVAQTDTSKPPQRIPCERCGGSGSIKILELAKLNPEDQIMRELAAESFNVAATNLAPRRKYNAAVAMTLRACAVEPTVSEVWSNLGNYFWNMQRFEEAKQVLERAIQLNPNHAISHCNLGLVLHSLGDLDQAEKYFDKAIRLDTDPKEIINTRWNRALLYLAKGDYKRGFRDYDTRLQKARLETTGAVQPWENLKATQTQPKFLYHRTLIPLWKGESLKGKTIFVASEQGIGDNIAFARFMPWLCDKAKAEGGKVQWCLMPSLVSLFWNFRCYDNLTFIPENVPLNSLGADYYVFEASLPKFFGCTLDNLPPDPGHVLDRSNDLRNAVALPKIRDPNAFKIGICWTGNPGLERNEERTVPLDLLLNLATIPNVWLHSFQVGKASQQISEIGAEQLICDLGPQLEGMGLTACASAMREMDLIITSCTSIAHLGGSLGMPTWVMLCVDPFWMWMRNRSDSPWYPSVRLFRQPRSKDWPSVMTEVRAALVKLLNERKPGSASDHFGSVRSASRVMGEAA